MMRILIAEDQGMMREGLALMLGKQPDFEVVGTAEDGFEIIQLSKKLKPNIIIMDISMPNLNGIEATRIITRDCPEIKVIALSMYPNKRFVKEMLKAGASGYVLKSYVFEELINAINTIHAGEKYLSPKITNLLVDNYLDADSEENSSNKLDSLTSREKQVIQLIAEGLNIKQIAAKLSISPKTAHANRKNIIEKLELSGVAELTKFAIKEGLTSLEF